MKIDTNNYHHDRNVDMEKISYSNSYQKGSARIAGEMGGYTLDISGTVTDNAAYGMGELKSAEDVMQDAGQKDIALQRNYMAVMSNSMSAQDYKKMQEARRKAAEAEKDKKQEALYQSYCKKYGKANVDEIMLRNNIKVGMPFSVIKAFCNYKLTDDNGSSKWYDVKYGGTYYDENSNSFKPREYNFAALIREWSIRVENGVVKYVGHHK